MTKTSEISNDVLLRSLERERARRKLAERLLEEKSSELYESFKDLEISHSALKEQQQQTLMSEKMASLGVLSAGIAHEINNPVGYVHSNLCTLREYTPVFFSAYTMLAELVSEVEENSPLADRCRTIRDFLEETDVDELVSDTSDILDETMEGLQRIRDIVTDLQSYARSNQSSMAPVAINACIRATASLVRTDPKYDCEYIDHLSDVPDIVGNAGKLRQVFMNLIVNATQAVEPGRGQITMRTAANDESLIIEIEDNGAGIDEKTQERLFEPFFTTKEEGVGTGLGLSVSQGIIADHGGKISVRSELGTGTIFSIELPLAGNG